MKILGEMKRRNVFRIGMAYIVASWVLIQIGYVTAAYFDAPTWAMGLFLTFLISGFPVVLWFSWTFSITTEGLRKESDVNQYDSLTRRTGSKLDYVTMALLAVIVGMVTLEKYMPVPTAEERTTKFIQPAEPELPVVIEENSIAVLPLSI